MVWSSRMMGPCGVFWGEARILCRLGGTRWPPSERWQELWRMRAQLGACVAELGEDRFHGFPETRTVVHFLEMREFMRGDVVDHRQREMHEPPVEADLAIRGATAPARGGRGQRKAGMAHA